VKASIPSYQKFVGLKVLLDTANGAAYKIAPEIFWELGCNVTTYNNSPNGVNINDGCGAVHPEFLAAKMKEQGADIGIVLDGDADRLIVIDENGEILDGDHIIAGIVTHLKKQDLFESSGVVVTTMSNLGFENYMNAIGVNDVVRTNVGDKYITRKLAENGYKIGGEQSGHIIMPKSSSTGDGILSAIQLISAMKINGWKASDVGKLFKKVPQVIHNVLNKNATEEQMNKIADDFSNQETRVVIRRSGTEAHKVRIMVETNGDVQSLAQQIAKILP
jgi:phosphoglucosamine mutase